MSGLRDLVARALQEDIGPGDLTVRYFTDPQARASVVIAARTPCVLAGLEAAREAFFQIEPHIAFEPHAADGQFLEAKSLVATVTGPLAPILSAERVALNFLQRLCGIATLTRRFVEAVRGTPAQIYDTRKTTPGLRALEKAAVLAGGGHNHRMGLYDMVMIKDNHLVGTRNPAALQDRIDSLHREHPGIPVEIEVDSLDQLEMVYRLRGVSVVLLDNMPPPQLRQAVALRPPGLLLEASGGVTLDTVRAIAETGVDRISIGALTHSPPAADIGLDWLSAAPTPYVSNSNRLNKAGRIAPRGF